MQALKITNVAELRQRKGSLGVSAELQGYYTAGDGGGGEFYWDNTSVLTDNDGTIFQVSGTATGRWVRKIDDHISVKHFGAKGDGATNDTTAIQNAISYLTTGGNVVFPKGSYLVNTEITLLSNITLDFEGGAKLLHASGVITQNILKANTKTNIIFKNLIIEGNGLAGVSAIYLISCDNVYFENPIIKKSGAAAIQLDGCSKINVKGGELSSSYYYGLQDRDGFNNTFTDTMYYQNGNTGVASSTGGRGIMLWRCVQAYVSGNSFIESTEFGLRIYSEIADTTSSYGNVISGNFFRDNVVVDLVLYDESLAGTLIKQNIIKDNVIHRTVNPTSPAAVLLHGGENTIENVHVYKTGAFGNFIGFQWYFAVDCKLINCSVKNTAHCATWETTIRCTMDGMFGDGVSTVNGLGGVNAGGQDCLIINTRATHGGPGVSDVAMINYNATSKHTYINNNLDGFQTGIYFGDEDIALFENTTTNSVGHGIRKSGNDLTGQEFRDNSWDIATPWELSALNKTKSFYDNAKTSYLISPANLSWSLGDICYNSSPVNSGNIGWVCTAAGTPGTWKEFGRVEKFKKGTSTQSGTGVATIFTIAHSLGTTPTYVNVQPGSANAQGISYITADATNITVNYTVAPVAGTNNLTFYWEATI